MILAEFTKQGDDTFLVKVINPTVNRNKWQVTDVAMDKRSEELPGTPVLIDGSHVTGIPGGTFIKSWRTKGGIVGEFKPANSEVLQGVRDGKYKLVSPSLIPLSAKKIGDVVVVEDFKWNHVLFTPNPAFDGVGLVAEAEEVTPEIKELVEALNPSYDGGEIHMELEAAMESLAKANEKNGALEAEKKDLQANVAKLEEAQDTLIAENKDLTEKSGNLDAEKGALASKLEAAQAVVDKVASDEKALKIEAILEADADIAARFETKLEDMEVSQLDIIASTLETNKKPESSTDTGNDVFEGAADGPLDIGTQNADGTFGDN